jgi:hypothetical protein
MATMSERPDFHVPHEWRTTLATLAAIVLAAAVVFALLFALMRSLPAS